MISGKDLEGWITAPNPQEAMAAVSDTITLPRETVEQMRGELYALVRHADGDCGELDCEECEPLRPIRDAIALLDAALKEAE